MPEGDTGPMGELRGETIPILAARDIAETIGFYGELGFAVVRLYDAFGPPYLLLRRDDVEGELPVRRERRRGGGPDLEHASPS